MAKRQRRTKAQIEASKGLGDTIEKITEATGIKAAVKFLLGEDCGCDERKEKLNKLFPYNKPNCLTEKEYITLKTFFENRGNRDTITPNEQSNLLPIYSRVFNVRQQPTSCGSCWQEIITKLNKIVNEYESEH
jgi:hypothetical protein